MSPLVKVVLAGDEEVGKSSIVARIKNNTFSDKFKAHFIDIYDIQVDSVD